MNKLDEVIEQLGDFTPYNHSDPNDSVSCLAELTFQLAKEVDNLRAGEKGSRLEVKPNNSPE